MTIGNFFTENGDTNVLYGRSLISLSDLLEEDYNFSNFVFEELEYYKLFIKTIGKY